MNAGLRTLGQSPDALEEAGILEAFEAAVLAVHHLHSAGQGVEATIELGEVLFQHPADPHLERSDTGRQVHGGGPRAKLVAYLLEPTEASLELLHRVSEADRRSEQRGP